MEDRLPYGRILLFAICNMTNALSTSTLYPYASNMIMDFGLTSDRSETGYYAGYVCGSIMLGRAVGSPVWGWLADKYGRKPVLLTSLLSLALGSIAFGIAQSFSTAILSLLFAGLFCSLSAIGKTCLSEVVTPAQQARAMSFYALGWFYGQIAGYSIGGFLVHPEKTGLVKNGFLVRFPYLLPNLVCATLAGCAIIGVLLYYRETLIRPPSSGQLSTSTDSEKPISLFKSRAVCRVVGLYSLEVFCNTGFIETFPLWCWSSRMHGGLDLGPEEIGLTLAVSYAILGAVQSSLYAKILKRFGLIGTVAVSSLAIAPVLVGIPFLSEVEGWALNITLAGVCLLYYLLCFNVFTSIFVLTNNSACARDRAKINGFSMALGYVIKGSTPILVGFTFAYTSENGTFYPFDHSFVFTVLACCTLIATFLTLTLPKSLENAYTADYSEMNDTSRDAEIELPPVKIV